MHLFGRPIGDYAFMAFLWAASVFYTLVALGFTPEAGAVPLLVGVPLIVLTSIDLVAISETKAGRLLRRIDPAAAPSAPDEDDAPPANKQWLALSMMGLFIVLFILIGVLPAVAVYITASMRVLGGYKFRTAAFVALIFAACAYTLFEILLDVDLYPGLISL
ncbi:MAG: tripartite tricarboxylate transporter TctB family protein [Hyphomonadaceae bacterium]|nr:tripartite tricarboxylate transporter TctB family protein [Hyphomonadaceae bacterium]